MILTDSLYYERTYVSLYVLISDPQHNINIELLFSNNLDILTYYNEDLLSGTYVDMTSILQTEIRLTRR